MDLLLFLDFLFNAASSGMPFIVFCSCLFIPLFLIGSIPHFIKKVILYWR